ncbi:hypothetical protein GCM10011506_01830 [Marivirga lumbricoides]|uniref:Uncharacterized protein n=1 Tax=Marivirga lumbricoides TaxID=1046115 RepID=A0ABQ1LAA7_9BACT|nr:hypothetical protein GCM10011506_01830 [Marivirga lumbricoides]
MYNSQSTIPDIIKVNRINALSLIDLFPVNFNNPKCIIGMIPQAIVKSICPSFSGKFFPAEIISLSREEVNWLYEAEENSGQKNIPKATAANVMMKYFV